MTRPIIRDPAIMGGAFVFEGTRVTIRRIRGLVRRGVPLEEILRDYDISEEDVQNATSFAEYCAVCQRKRRPCALHFRLGTT